MSGRRFRAVSLLACQLLAWPLQAWAQEGCPSSNVNDVLNDPRVQEALDQAWRDSLEGTENEHEEGGYISQCQNRNVLTGEVTYYTLVLRWPPGDRDSSAPGYPPRQDANCRTVATFHTHPGGEPGGPDDDGYINPIPSPEDYLVAGNDGLPGIIRWGTGDETHDFTYNYGTVGDEPREPGWECIGPLPGSGFGDPHMLTLDGLAYDFMAIGDFVLMRTVDVPGQPIEIQARLQPYGTRTAAAVTTGIAVGDGRDRVEWRLEDRQLLVNGVPRTLEPGAVIRLRSHAVLRHDADGPLLVTSLGDRLRVFFNTESVDYTFRVARHRAGKVRGLFGNFDGDPDNDLQSADGQIVNHQSTDAPDYQRPLYARFGESWRVSPSAALFATPYRAAAGADVRTFPRPLPPASAEARAAAESACRSAGVTDAVVLDSCVFDYLQAGGVGFVAAAARVDRGLRDGIPLAVAHPLVVDRDEVGRLEGTTRDVAYPLTLTAGTYLFDGRGTQDAVWRLLNASGDDMLAGMNLMAANPRRVTLPAGRYRLTVAIVPEATASRFRFRVRKPAEPEVSALLPGARASGRIDTPGQMRVFRLRLEAGRYDFVPQSTGELSWSLTGSDGYNRFDANQSVFMERAMGIEIAAGTYTLSVAGREWAGTGTYDVVFTRTP